jgi:hypothetical protein
VNAIERSIIASFPFPEAQTDQASTTIAQSPLFPFITINMNSPQTHMSQTHLPFPPSTTIIGHPISTSFNALSLFSRKSLTLANQSLQISQKPDTPLSSFLPYSPPKPPSLSQFPSIG